LRCPIDALAAAREVRRTRPTWSLEGPCNPK
jgi:hypothetical protein